MAETMENTALHLKGKITRPSDAQLRYLRRGLKQPGGKLPLFDVEGQRIKERTIRSCMSNGWCELWFRNPVNPAWLVCKLTAKGRSILQKKCH